MTLLKGWVYDADWRYFIFRRPGHADTLVAVESLDENGDWMRNETGLTPDDVMWLMEHPTPGAYNGRTPR